MRRINQAQSPARCREILKSERRGVLAVLGDGGYPYAVPVNFYYDEGENLLYIHGAREGHRVDALSRCDRVCFTTWDSGNPAPGDWALNVTSVVCFGRAEPVRERARLQEKLWALATKYYPDPEEAHEDLRRNLDRAALYAITPEHISGKLVHEK